MSNPSLYTRSKAYAKKHPNQVIAAGVVTFVVAVKVNKAKPPAKLFVSDEFAKQLENVLSYVEDGYSNTGNLPFDRAYTEGAWFAAERVRNLLDQARIAK